MDEVLDKRSEHFLRNGLLIFVASVALTLPIYLWGIPAGNDLPHHYRFAHQVDSALQAGEIYPGWSLAANRGLGDAGIRFYPPLSYYVLVIFKTISGSWYEGSVFAFGLWFLIGSLGIYFLCREWLDGASATLAAIAFAILPYHVNQIYNAFLYAEFAGIAILPFCFLFVTRLTERTVRLINIIGLAISLAALVLTHLPTAVMGFIVLTVYAGLILWKAGAPKSFIALVGACGLGALASAFFWIKIVVEIDFLKHATDEFIRSSYDFRVNFLGAWFYIDPEQYASRSLWFADTMFGLTLALIATAWIVLRLRPGERRYVSSGVIGALFAGIFLSTVASLPIWEKVGVLQKIQFPFRFLGVISLCAAVYFGSAWPSFSALLRSPRRPYAITAAGIFLIVAAFSIAQVIRPASYTPPDRFETILTEIEQRPSCECWWPVWAKSDPLIARSEAFAKPASVTTGKTRHSAPYVADETGLTVYVLYYPFWAAKIDGLPAKVEADETGFVHIPWSEPTDKVELAFSEPTYVRTAQMISVLTWIVMGALAAAIMLFSFRPSLENQWKI